MTVVRINIGMFETVVKKCVKISEGHLGNNRQKITKQKWEEKQLYMQ